MTAPRAPAPDGDAPAGALDEAILPGTRRAPREPPAFEITRFDARHLPLLLDFWRRVSRRPDDDAFARWRYLDCPGQRIWVALRMGTGGAVCGGTLSAVARRYRSGQEELACFELFDWACLPEARSAGLGLRLLLAMRREAEVTLSIGGSGDTRKLAPRVSSWRGALGVFVLPLRGALEAALARQLPLPPGVAGRLAALPGRWFEGARPRPGSGEGVVPVGSVGDELGALYRGPTGHALLPIAEPAWVAWLRRGPARSGLFFPLYFVRGKALVGWSLGRIFEGESGVEGALVEVFARVATRRLYGWMVAETVQRLRAFAPRSIEARASCPVLCAALRDNRFLHARTVPVHVWPEGAVAPGSLHLTSAVADLATRPCLGPFAFDDA